MKKRYITNSFSVLNEIADLFFILTSAITCTHLLLKASVHSALDISKVLFPNYHRKFIERTFLTCVFIFTLSLLILFFNF